MKWLFFVQSNHLQLLSAVGFMLEAFREALQDPVEVHGEWLDMEAGVYKIQINDAYLARQFDMFLENNPEYDTYRESLEIN